jgi:hypothetical protein
MGSKFIGALKCFMKRPADAMRIMLSFDTYLGLFLAILLLACGVAAYILALVYSMGGL